uniref:ARAD1C20944p n=1 Tax=Blastobotrys adeninivorans TaxID=409370 RepID=A0A060T1I9_BLAAD
MTPRPPFPLVHFSPPVGFMNDPNGLVKVGQTYHLYYQHNPHDSVWGPPEWGHATSTDLIQWTDHGTAISKVSEDEGVFSGCCVVDKDNTSQLFSGTKVPPEERIVAIFTSNWPDNQVQSIAYSLDGGYTFKRYAHNPVLDISSTQFRDPKVFYHQQTGKWIMSVTKTQKYEVAFYGSSNLIDWQELSTFTGGFTGYQYEMPDLVQVPVSGTGEKKWVLMLSINPGSPIGGSMVQYFIGDFDGREFTPEDRITRMADYGKDWYASQTWSNSGDEVLCIGWASNWQYCNQLPVGPWKSTMSLPRRLTLAKCPYNPEYQGYVLAQQAPDVSAYRRTKISGKLHQYAEIEHQRTSKNGIFEFAIDVTNCGTEPADASLSIEGYSQQGQKLTMGLMAFEAGAHFYIDRTQKEFSHPLFTEKLSAFVPLNSSGHIKVHGIVDRGIVEIYLNDGQVVFTNSYILPEKESLQQLAISTKGYEAQATIYELVLEAD